MSTLTEQQQMVVESIDANVLVSAGAGSGKTHVLVERYIEILRQKPELKVSNLVAVTYTKKAATEMRTRLKARMEQLIAEATGEAQRQRWSDCRVDVDVARIGTIHSLCDSILKAFPAEAGIDPRFEILDELERAELLRKSIDKTMLEVPPDHTEEYEFLSSYAVDDVRKWLASFLNAPAQFDEALASIGGIQDEDLAEHAGRLLERIGRRVIDDLFCQTPWPRLMEHIGNCELEPGNKLDAMRRRVIELDESLRSQASISVGQQIATLRLMQQEITLKVGGNSDNVKALKESLRQIRENIKARIEKVPDGLSESDIAGFRCIRALVSLCRKAQAIYTEGKRAHQKLDFNDLIAATFDLLRRDDSPARRYYNDEIAAILVDEFQDTNSMQSQLLGLLAGAQTRLFLIGDDKQSIYKFQGADVSTFNQWKRLLSGSGSIAQPGISLVRITGPAQVGKLSKSFRSHRGIVGFVNATFQRLLAAGEEVEAYRASHQPLDPSRVDDPDSNRIEIVRLLADESEERVKSSQARDTEARALAAWIEQKVQSGMPVLDKTAGGSRPIRYGDFAILVQRNDDFAAIEPWLSDMSIPYVTMGGSSFLNQQETFDLENILRFLWSPQDSHSLFGVLRSPMFGVTDDIIHAAAAEHRAGLWSRVQAVAADKGAGWESLQPAVEVLRGLLAVTGVLPLGELVRKIIADTGFDIILMGLPGGRQRSRNVWKFAMLAAEHAHLSILEFCDSLSSMRQLKVKQSAAPVDSGDSVKLMTIHGSKGLEFPAVALPVMGQDAARLSGKCLFHREYGIAFDGTRDGDEEKPALFRLACLLEKDMSIAEKKRLLYVAMTRARDYLGIFLNQRPARESFHCWIDSALEPESDGVGYSQLSLNTEQVVECQRLLKQSPTARNKAEAATGAVDLALLDALAPGEDKTLRRRASIPVTPGGGSAISATVFGDFFHKLMERLANRMERPGPQVMIDVAISELGLAHPQIIKAVVSDGNSLLDKFFCSPLFELMSNARRRLNENPYVILQEGQLQMRRTDLLIEDAQGMWHVIDYKTDHLDAAHIESKAKEHAEQLKNYVEDITALTGKRPRAGVYFARLGELVTVEV